MWQMLLADLTEPEKNTNVEEIKGLSLDFQSRHVVVSAQVRIIVSLVHYLYALRLHTCTLLK